MPWWVLLLDSQLWCWCTVASAQSTPPLSVPSHVQLPQFTEQITSTSSPGTPHWWAHTSMPFNSLFSIRMSVWLWSWSAGVQASVSLSGCAHCSLDWHLCIVWFYNMYKSHVQQLCTLCSSIDLSSSLTLKLMLSSEVQIELIMHKHRRPITWWFLLSDNWLWC